MTSQNFDTRALSTLAASAAFSVLALVASVLLLARTIDNGERRHEHAMVAKQFANLAHDLEERVSSDLDWDEAVLNLDNKFDPDWARRTLTTPFGDDVTNRLVTVFDHDDRMELALEHALPVQPPRQAATAAAAAGLLARIRRAERVTRPVSSAIGKAAAPVMISAVEVVQGRPMLAVASLAGSDSGMVRLLHAHAPVVIYWSDLQATIMPALADRLLLRKPMVYVGPPQGSGASLALTDAKGQPSATLAWAAARPALKLLLGGLPFLGVVVSALVAAILLAYRQGVAGTRALQESEARAHHLAFHDGLTGLPNRRLFNDRIAQALSRALRHGGDIAVLLLDLDRFKLVNDTYGHQCGDELIQEVARRLRLECRDEDTCARLGGDEFVILARDIDAAEAAAFAQRIGQSLAVPIALSACTIYTGASIGISISRDGAGAPMDLLRQADLALYKAKEQARGNFRFFEIEMDHALQNRRGLENDLRAALEAQALTIAFQPQYDCGIMIGVEALARWTHPERGPISPAFFVPLAEEFGLIEALGRFVLRQAFAAGRNWPKLSVAVNISATQLRMPGFLAELDSLLHETGADPRHFDLEITEGVLVANDGQIHETLSKLRQIGFRLTLDDFGTGYSSLSYLGRFPIDRIKIDRSFVAGIPHDKAATSIVRAMVALAGALNLGVIAEGVETMEQKNTLVALGCTAMQGFLLGRPMPAHDIPIQAGAPN